MALSEPLSGWQSRAYLTRRAERPPIEHFQELP